MQQAQPTISQLLQPQPDKIESGMWATVRGELPLASNILSQIIVTVYDDGTLQCQTRSADNRTLDGIVADVEAARDRLTEQLERRFTQCPLFKTANAA
jgi:hypothetical protein